MSILNRALDEIDSMKHSDGAWNSIYTYEAIEILKELARDYELGVSKEKARADAYEAIIKNLRLSIVPPSREEDE